MYSTQPYCGVAKGSDSSFGVKECDIIVLDLFLKYLGSSSAGQFVHSLHRFTPDKLGLINTLKKRSHNLEEGGAIFFTGCIYIYNLARHFSYSRLQVNHRSCVFRASRNSNNAKQKQKKV